VKNKVSPPFKQVEFDIMYGEGISKVGEILDLGVKAGLVDKSGAWFSYDSIRIGQGRENAKKYLREHPDIAAAIEQQLRQTMGMSRVAAEPTALEGHNGDPLDLMTDDA
jgi:recombination protein RecA